MRNSIDGLNKIFSYYYNQKPAQFVYFVTKRCNADCLFCFNKGERGKNELTIDEVEQITKTMYPVYWLLLSGGEPFLRDDLDRIVRLFRENTGVNYTQIPTNGYLTDKIIKKTSIIAKTSPGMKLAVAVSLDASREEHNRMRNLPGCYERAEETIKKLVALKSKTPNLGVFINMTLSSYNQEKIIEYYNFFKNKFKVDSVKVGYVRGDVNDKDAINVSEEYLNQYRSFFRNKLKKKDIHGFVQKLYRSRDLLMNDMIHSIIKTGKMPLPCKAGINSLVMYEDGAIHACEILKKRIGNIRDFQYDFKEFWSSKEAVNFRRWKKTCACTYECALTMSILYDIKSMMKIFLSSI